MGGGQIERFIRNLAAPLSEKVQLSESDADLFEKAASDLIHIRNVAIAHLTFLASYVELEETAAALAINASMRYRGWGADFFSDCAISMNMRLTSVMTLAKFLLELLTKNQSGSFVNAQDLAKKGLVAERESSFDFRFSEMLRNASQHEMLPVTKTSVGIGSGIDGARKSFVLSCSHSISKKAIEELQPRTTFGKATREEVLDRPDTSYDLMDKLRVYSATIDRMAKNYLDNADAETILATVRSSIEKFGPIVPDRDIIVGNEKDDVICSARYILRDQALLSRCFESTILLNAQLETTSGWRAPDAQLKS